jgi:hypothetical protein
MSLLPRTLPRWRRRSGASAIGINGDTSDSIAQVLGCGGTLASNPQLCAALNRHVAGETTAQQQNAINGKQYGFPYDDYAGQSPDISVANPQYAVVAVGW